MVKGCIKMCSKCGLNGHNTRSCVGINNNNNNIINKKEKYVKLFGFEIHVPVEDESATSSLDMRKCKSAPDLITCGPDHENIGAGYLSDGPPVGTRKRGVPWTEREHLSFLSGLEKLGKGNWKAISRLYVPSRTATQVASHAQKYFNRVNLHNKRNRRSSLFDMSLNEPQIKSNPPPKLPFNTLQMADILSILNANQNGDSGGQANIAAKAAATPSTMPRVLSYAPCYGVPDFYHVQHLPMVGMSGNGTKSFDPVTPSVPMMYIPNPAHFYHSKNPVSLASNPLSIPTFPRDPSSMAMPYGVHEFAT